MLVLDQNKVNKSIFQQIQRHFKLLIIFLTNKKVPNTLD